MGASVGGSLLGRNTKFGGHDPLVPLDVRVSAASGTSWFALLCADSRDRCASEIRHKERLFSSSSELIALPREDASDILQKNNDTSCQNKEEEGAASATAAVGSIAARSSRSMRFCDVVGCPSRSSHCHPQFRQSTKRSSSPPFLRDDFVSTAPTLGAFGRKFRTVLPLIGPSPGDPVLQFCPRRRAQRQRFRS